jgi:hypothetical protein
MAEGAFPIRCPTYQHTHELPITAEFLRQNGMNEDDVRLWEINTLRAYDREMNKGVERGQMCPTANCINVIFPDEAEHPGEPNNRHARCQNCEREHCYKCVKEGRPHFAHHGKRCEDLGNQPEWMDFTNKDIRPCPYCKAPYSKDGGCNAVQCQKCRATFHYNKGKLRMDEWNQFPQFFHDFYPVVDREYRLEDEEGYAPGRESNFPGHGRILNQEEARNQH